MNSNKTYNGIELTEEQSRIYTLLAEVCDPEVPVLTILDLGIVRDVIIKEKEVEIVITPTYSGCPAMDTIAMDIKLKLSAAGYEKVKISTVLHPAWTTDWMSEEGKLKLREYGIAPPPRLNKTGISELNCPRCGSKHTVIVSEFGSTACKSLCQCKDCLEFFDYFKCH